MKVGETYKVPGTVNDNGPSKGCIVTFDNPVDAPDGLHFSGKIEEATTGGSGVKHGDKVHAFVESVARPSQTPAFRVSAVKAATAG